MLPIRRQFHIPARIADRSNRGESYRQENCKVLSRRGQVHVFGQEFVGRTGILAEKWTSPRTLQFPGLTDVVIDKIVGKAIIEFLAHGTAGVKEEV